MDPQQIAAMIASGDPAQIRQAQTLLQAQGYYTGDIDGSLGRNPESSQTMAALRRYQAAEADRTQQSQTDIRQQELQLQQQQLKNQRDEREAAQRQREEELQRQQAREEARDPLTEQFVPFAAGAGVGMGYGELTNRGLAAFERGNAQALKEIADEIGPTERLTASQLNRSRATGAARAAERFSPSGPVRQTAGVLGRAASYGVPAAVVYNEWQRYQQAADNAPTETERVANQQIANGLLGTLTGLGVEGGRRFFLPHREAGVGEAQARIQTARDLAGRMDQREAAPARAPAAQAQPADTNVTPLRPAAQPQGPVTSVGDYARARLTPPGADPSGMIAENVIYDDYVRYAQTRGETPMKQGEFRQAMRDQEMRPQAFGGQRRYLTDLPDDQPMRNSERIGRAVEATGGKPSRTKRVNYDTLRKNLTDDNKAEVAKALRLPENADRKTILGRARELLNSRGVSSIVLPIVAGSTAAAAAYNQARASDGGNFTGSDAGDAAAVGIGTGVGTEVARRGLNRVLAAIPQVAKTAAGVGAAGGAAPDMIDAMTSYTPEELASARNWAARNLPEGLQVGAINQAREMAQVPEPNPMRNGAALNRPVPQSNPELEAAMQDMMSLFAQAQP